MRAAIPARLEAHHVATLGAIALGLVVALGATQTWDWRFGIDPRGIDTARGRATVAAGVALIVLAVSHALGAVSFRTYALLAACAAILAIAMPVSYFVDPIGRPDPALADPALGNSTTPWMTIDATTGLAMPAIGGALLLLVLAAHAMLRTARGRTVRASDAAALLLASFAVASVFMPWVGARTWSDAGIVRWEGALAIIAGSVAIACSALRIAGAWRDWLSRIEVPAAILLLFGPLAVYGGTVGDADPAFDNLLVMCVTNPCARIDAGPGLYLALIASAGFAALRCIPPAIGLLSAPASEGQSATVSSDP